MRPLSLMAPPRAGLLGARRWLVTTLMACTDPALSRQEQRFLQILASVDRAAAVADRLTLYAKDRPVARLVAVYFQ